MKDVPPPFFLVNVHVLLYTIRASEESEQGAYSDNRAPLK